MTGESFIDIDSCQRPKAGQQVAGDVFASRRIKEESRLISVLSDGLGSGVKASVLANLTATMALRYTAAFVDVRKSASTIMDTLPVCEVRKISYSTFTIVDMSEEGSARVIEHGNPALLWLRGAEPQAIKREEFTLEQWKDRTIRYSEMQVERGDRLICFSDGVAQSGLGRRGWPFGWGAENVVRYVQEQIRREPEMGSGELARRVVAEALGNDGGSAKDDITCGVVYYRNPRRLLVLTGPPFGRDRDGELGELIRQFPGRKVICGGTTANIVSRELNRPVRVCLEVGRASSRVDDTQIPPSAVMEGVDLVTEGTMTLARVGEMLEGERNWPDTPASDLLRLMVESDIVEFVVGTRINDAHQDPNVPVELDLRRNVVRRICTGLERRYLKETRVRYL